MKSREKKVLALVLLLAAALVGCGGGDGEGSSGDIQYVAIGASDATGIGAIPPTRGYVFRIEDELENRTDAGVDLYNLGIPGAGVEEMRELETPAAEALNPDLITIWAGGNDLVRGRSVEEFSSDLDAMLSSLASSSAFIAIGDLPDLTSLPRFRDDPDPDVTPERVAAFNQAISAAAARYGAALVPLSRTPISNILVSEDGFHPSNEGHEQIAEEFLAVIVPHFTTAPAER